MRLMNRVRNIFMLLILLVVSAQGAWAQSGEWKDNAATAFASGSGTKENPYVIETAAQFAYMAKHVAGTNNISKGKYYVLNADIDLAAHYWNPIGTDNNHRFLGDFDGRGHVVKNLKVKWTFSGWTTAGLFGRIRGESSSWARVSNLIIDGAKVEKAADGKNITGNGCGIGILAGEVRQYSEISNIIVKNSVNSDGGSSFTVSGSGCVRIGGILGNTEKDNDSNPGVYRIFNLATQNVQINYSKMTYSSSSTDSYVGGVIGRFRQKKADDANNIFAENLFSDVTISCTNHANIKFGNVLANKDGVAEKNNWYYTNSVSGTNVDTSGDKKTLAFGSTFITQANDFLYENKMSDVPCWGYSQATGFVFIGTLSGTHESTHLTNAHVQKSKKVVL